VRVTEPNAFTGAGLDRAGDGRRRDAAWLAEQRAHPAARAVIAGSAGIHMAGDRLALVPLQPALGEAPAAEEGAGPSPALSAEAAGAPPEPLLLGVDSRGPLFAVDEDAPVVGELAPLIAAGGRRGEPPAPGPGSVRPDTGTRAVGLREAAARLPRADGGLAAYTAALLNWHRRHRHCANCGQPTDVREGGLVRLCPRCGAEHHPRTDPVVIMLVTDGDRLLLGRQPSWPARRYSALAGFVEPGESLEEAVAREVREEAGVTVGPPRYVASQPWPFPASLMLGFTVPWVGGEPAAHDELQDARWFSRKEVAAAAAHDTDGWSVAGDDDRDGGLLLPPRLAIARRLVERWLAAEPRVARASSGSRPAPAAPPR
jgi:NAD+ diphosphatase